MVVLAHTQQDEHNNLLATVGCFEGKTGGRQLAYRLASKLLLHD